MNGPCVPHRAAACRPGRSAGHTLLELVFGLAVVTTLMGAMVASIAMTSRSIEGSSRQTRQALTAAGALEELNADLAAAVEITERTATSVAFVVPDRDGDGFDEAIRYEWTGPEGGRLLRQMNGTAAAAVVEDVRHFALEYRLKPIAPRAEPSGKPPGGKPPPSGSNGGGCGGRTKWRRGGRWWVWWLDRWWKHKHPK
jgi:type II secretory pathway component PulJ